MRKSRGVWAVEFMSEPRSSPQPLWFHLTCSGVGGRRMRFIWLNADLCLGLGRKEALQAVRPVARLNGGVWRRLTQTEVIRRPSGGHMLAFQTSAGCERADVAFCYPYGPDDLERTLSQIASVWAAEPIGLTGKGRLLVRLSAGLPGGRQRRPGVYLVARQHAGETPGSWVLDGLLRAVASQDGQLKGIQWWAMPFADLDGVIAGDYGKDAFPWDLNRAWSAMPMRPEVLAIQEDLRRFAQKAHPRLVIDLHAPGGGEQGFYQFLCRDDRPAEHKEASASFTPHLAARFPALSAESLARVPRYPSRWNTTETLTNWAWDALDKTLCVSLETAYQGLNSRTWLAPEGYRSMGHRIAKAAAEWLRSQ